MTKIREYVEQLLLDCESQYQSWLTASDRDPSDRKLENDTTEIYGPRDNEVVVDFRPLEVHQ